MADVPRFMERREQTALIFSDQIPFWVKIGNRQVVFAGHESARSSKESRKMGASIAGAQMSQVLAPLEDAQDKVVQEQMTQKRGPAKSGDDKFRVTLEARQAVSGGSGAEIPRASSSPRCSSAMEFTAD